MIAVCIQHDQTAFTTNGGNFSQCLINRLQQWQSLQAHLFSDMKCRAGTYEHFAGSGCGNRYRAIIGVGARTDDRGISDASEALVGESTR